MSTEYPKSEPGPGALANAVPTGAANKAAATSANNSTHPAAKPARQPGPIDLDMSVQLAGIHLKNPILAASGTFGYGIEFEDIVSLARLGGFVSSRDSRVNPWPAILRRASLKPPPEC